MRSEERILIVEDELIFSVSIFELLTKMGYRNVEVADNSEEAFSLISNNDYDLVFMDIFLGKGISGIDIVAQVKKTKDTPVIYLTGHSDNATLDKAKATLPIAFINKPVTETNLEIQLELFLKQK